MTLPETGNPDPPNDPREGPEPREPCPLCGALVKRLPNHLPGCPER